VIPQAIHDDTCVSSLSLRWLISEELAGKLVDLASRVPFGITIFSGHRTEEEQDKLRAEGRPTADNDKSTHVECPATGADIRFTLGGANINILDVEQNASWVQLGGIANLLGLRWGGGSPMDSTGIIPTDRNHFDLGPRKTGHPHP